MYIYVCVVCLYKGQSCSRFSQSLQHRLFSCTNLGDSGGKWSLAQPTQHTFAGMQQHPTQPTYTHRYNYHWTCHLLSHRVCVRNQMLSVFVCVPNQGSSAPHREECVFPHIPHLQFLLEAESPSYDETYNTARLEPTDMVTTQEIL